MTEFTEGRHPGEAILSEASRARSRDNITIPAGTGVVEPGTVLGVDSNGNYVPSTVAVADGAETAMAMNIHGVDATDAAVAVAAITRDAELNGACLVFEATVDTDAEKQAKIDELAAVGIIVR
jgi:hypothetical protein